MRVLPSASRAHTHRPAGRSPRQAGVALIEVLVSILLFSFAILGLVGLQAQAISLSLEADYRSRASLLADEIAAQMWLKKSVTVDNTVLTTWKSKVASSTQLPSGSGDVIPVTGVPNQADILIQWTAPSRRSTTSGTGTPSNFVTRVTLPST
ncbi:prepilin-type N-terminal cleavage/methylation domain-containing protein [Pseudacidovorax intermedius]|uniref:Type IV pilus assembly protein PilV n=1 Tax=Pseudacidovorax intermedius TaxID=433924 RepID=A0A147GKZ5_9BURK|nr:prepilin-type N-terminal cleavage/methylation domain-containing protein [Pseudacidovorax intermedius]KTT10331.1 hypothetical protein NS331_25060 [Pseudacidovorax intermedius]